MQQPDFQKFAAAISHLPENERSDIRRAFEFAVRSHAPQKREDGSPYVLHVIEVAKVVAGWKADRDTVIAALLHDVIEDAAVTKEDIVTTFGRHVALLVESMTKLTVSDLSADLPLDRKIETLRKLFDVMRYDMRSMLIKLADRLHNVLTIASLPTPERRKRFALETINVYHRIALHLGMRDVRHVYAEYCVPFAYDDGAEALAVRNLLFEEAKPLSSGIQHDLKHTNGAVLPMSIEVQPRNVLTFYLRRQAKGGNALPIDAFLVSIQVETEDDCYGMLRLLHTLYRPVSGQFRDYIAAPSDAGYQSLHTVVTLPDGRVVEIRIRTPEMERQARRGITLWLFDGQNIPPNFSWLKRTEQLDVKTRDSSAAFWEALQADILSETISVTIDRRRLSVPKGSTLLDAAYAAYDAKAGFLLSATVGGRAESLAFVLQEDDDVRLAFDQKMQADFSWLQMVVTQHARMLIVEVLKKSDRSERLALGASLVQKELDHYGKGLLSDLGKNQLQQASDHFRRRSFEDVLLMIGEGVIRARDVVFFLFPEHVTDASSSQAGGRYPFRLRLTATERPGRDALSLLQGIIRTVGVTIERTIVKRGAEDSMIDIVLSGSAADRFGFADFLEMLERQEWTSRVQTLFSPRQKAFLMTSTAIALAVIILDVVFFPSYQVYFRRFPGFPAFLLQAIPLAPIVAVNYYLLRLLRTYIVPMRSERWFLGMGLLLNILGLAMLVVRIAMLKSVQGSLLPLIAIFTASLLYMGFRFLQADRMMARFEKKPAIVGAKAVPHSTWKRKLVGYAIRLGAVTIWGLVPVYIRYTPVAAIAPLLRIFLTAIGVLLPFTMFHVCTSLAQKKRISFALPYNYAFWMLVVGQIGYAYLENLSLLYTSGTNLLLFNNFAPVIGLFVAVLFWRKDIPYLRRPDTMVWVFVLALLASFGSSLLVQSTSNALPGASVTFLGDLLAMISTFFDVILTLGQIQYIKTYNKTNGVLLNLHVFFYFLLVTSPLVFFGTLFGWLPIPAWSSLWLFGPGIGLLFGLGLLLNYEAFKRIDGYIAYLLFNLSVVVTFAFEVFIFHSVNVTYSLLLSAALILASSAIAEYLNSRCEKAG